MKECGKQIRGDFPAEIKAKQRCTDIEDEGVENCVENNKRKIDG